MGFEILTDPAFSTIEFTNPERTRALVPITVGYSGATVVLDTVNGVWTIKSAWTPGSSPTSPQPPRQRRYAGTCGLSS
jgi:hypothetical protein